MSFQGLTPEAFVDRSDSKNPATTCKGLTSSGRPCRRGLASTPGSSPGNSPLKGGGTHGVIAVLNDGDAAAFFCWQHKDQAQNLVTRMQQQQQNQQTKIVPLQKRSSIDTLAEKVGILDLEDADAAGEEKLKSDRRQARKGERRVKKRETLPPAWQQIQGPLMSVPEEVVQETLPATVRPQRRPVHRQERVGQSNVKASWSCCIQADDDYKDDGPPVRRRERHGERRSSSQTRPYSHRTRPNIPVPPPQHVGEQYRPSTGKQGHTQDMQTPGTPIRSPLMPTIPSQQSSPAHAQTQNFLSFIPQNLDPATTSSLLAELAKPFAKDDEAGYIYIFWLTPSSDASVPDDDTASTILDGDIEYQHLTASSHSSSSARVRQVSATSDRERQQRRHRTDQLTRFASIRHPIAAFPTQTPPPQILLKIGRAQNVHRRLAQWTKQCNQNITLVRYYPHYASEAADPSGPGGIKVPHVNRVERLIHVELRAMGWGKKGVEKCAECGREHKEWFEVPATKAGLRGVDEVVRRWVRWAEGTDG